MISIRDLSMSYGSFRAVDGLELEVERGEIVALLGPNGAGKTTTLKTLSGLLRPQSGSVTVAGHDVLRAPEAARAATAYLPDKPHLYELLSGWEYLAFVAGLWDLATGSWERIAAEHLEELGLAEVRHDLLESYSQGMRQKLLFIAGLIHAPQAWVLDEPMSGLDPRAARQMQDLLRQEADCGAAVLLSTHLLDLAERMCDRIVILDHGRRIAQGTIGELRGRHDATSGAPGGEQAARLEDLFLRLTAEAE